MIALSLATKLLVDDGSTDGTLAWLQELAADFPHVRSLCQNHQGPAAARNLGVECSVGDTIIFIDSDLVVTPNFLQAHAQSVQGCLLQGSERVLLMVKSSTLQLR